MKPFRRLRKSQLHATVIKVMAPSVSKSCTKTKTNVKKKKKMGAGTACEVS
jgi:hypothetical protein